VGGSSRRWGHSKKCSNDGKQEATSTNAANDGKQDLKKLEQDEKKAASHGDIVETIRLANEVYDKAKSMCKCHPGVSSIITTAGKELPGAAGQQAMQNEAQAAPATHHPPQSKAQKAAENEHAAFSAAAKAVPATAKDNGIPESMSKKTQNGLDNLENKIGLPANVAAQLNAKVAKKENEVNIDENTQKVVDSPAEKAEEEAEKKAEAKTEQTADAADAAGKIAAVVAKAASRGEDPVAATKKARQEQLEAEADKNAARAKSAGTTSASIKAGLQTTNNEAAQVERDHTASMMKTLTPGQGLRTAFLKIEESNVAPAPKDKEKDIVNEAEKDAGKLPSESNKNLSKEARAALEQEENRKKKAAQKPSEGDALEKMEKSIENKKLPGQEGDKMMYGKSQGDLANDIAGSPGENADQGGTGPTMLAEYEY